MNFSKNARVIRWILIAISFIIVTAILWNTYDFSKKYKVEERNKMKIIAEAQKSFFKLGNDKNFKLFRKAILELEDGDIETKRELIKKLKPEFDNLSINSGNNDLQLLILNSNKTIPSILTDEKGIISNTNNLDSIKEKDTLYLKKQLAIMKSQNKPIVLSYMIDNKKYTKQIYYRDSDLLTKLRYYPLALLLILALFSSVIFLVFKSSKIAEQNKLWAGMAKETAHQIGTPLSSLLGWIEILRMEKTDESTITEIEKDVYRLNTIADRFSKIGSIPKLEKVDIVDETKKSFNYLKSRFSNQITFTFNTNKSKVFVNANKQLFSWVIENLIKNAIDAMQGKGKLDVTISTDKNNVSIYILDSGKGIPKNQFKKVFQTGFTTKKRGWGLGLSLAKRIINEYHHGKIFVKSSTVGKGTTIELTLKVINDFN
jgi:signal transduction histidine kinase